VKLTSVARRSVGARLLWTSPRPAIRLTWGDSRLRSQLVLDLTGVEYLDSAGVKVLDDHLGRQPELVVSSGAVILRVLAITGLGDLLPVREI
jgi:anti-anti-sigma factor